MPLISTDEYCAAIDQNKMLSASDEELRNLIRARCEKLHTTDEIVIIACHMVLEQRHWARQP